jgi:hypothetical protein
MKKLLLLLVFCMIPLSSMADESVAVEVVWDLRGDMVPDGTLLRLRKNHVELHAGQVSNHSIVGVGGYVEQHGVNLSIGGALVDNKLGGFTRFGLKVGDQQSADIEGALHIYSQGLLLGSTAIRFNDKEEKRNVIRDTSADTSPDDDPNGGDTGDNGGGSGDNGGSETQPGSGDHDRGHGNDEGHWDSDNPGRGHGDDQVVGGGRNH